MKVQVISIIAATPERAWPIFSDLAALSDMMPDALVEVEGSGVGAVRTITNADGSKIQERLETFDPDNHTFSYAVIKSDAPLPFSEYLATVTLRAAPGNQCEVDWSSEFQVQGISEVEVKKMIEGAYRATIHHLSSKVTI